MNQQPIGKVVAYSPSSLDFWGRFHVFASDPNYRSPRKRRRRPAQRDRRHASSIQPSPTTSPASPSIYPAAPFLLAILTIVFAAVIALQHLLSISAKDYEETDDAFIAGNVVPISNKVAATVEQVFVFDNQDVAAGTLLIGQCRDIQAQLDHAVAEGAADESHLEVAKTNVQLIKANTDAALAQADAGVTQAQAAVSAAEAQLASSQADVTAAQADATQRSADLKRYQSADPRGISQQQLDAAHATADACFTRPACRFPKARRWQLSPYQK